MLTHTTDEQIPLSALDKTAAIKTHLYYFPHQAIKCYIPGFTVDYNSKIFDRLTGTINLAKQLDRKDLNSENSLIPLANMQQKAFSVSLGIPLPISVPSVVM